MRISDGSSAVCSSDLTRELSRSSACLALTLYATHLPRQASRRKNIIDNCNQQETAHGHHRVLQTCRGGFRTGCRRLPRLRSKTYGGVVPRKVGIRQPRSEEHTSELQSLMRTSYAVFCLKKKNTPTTT